MGDWKLEDCNIVLPNSKRKVVPTKELFSEFSIFRFLCSSNMSRGRSKHARQICILDPAVFPLNSQSVLKAPVIWKLSTNIWIFLEGFKLTIFDVPGALALYTVQ